MTFHSKEILQEKLYSVEKQILKIGCSDNIKEEEERQLLELRHMQERLQRLIDKKRKRLQ